MSDAKLTIAIGGKLDASLNAAAKEAQAVLNGLNGGSGKSGISKVFSGIGQTIADVGKASMASFAGIASGMAAVSAASVNTGMDFESAMSQVAATMRLDKMSAEYGLIEEQAKELGKSTAFTMTQAAEGANILAMAGYTAEEIYSTLPTVLNLAGAGAIDMADSARYIATTLNTMGIEKTDENAQHLADVFAVVASSVQTDVAGIGEAFIRLGGTGATLKDGAEEAAALMGILADAGIESAEIGTHMRNIIMNLREARNDDAAAQFEALGISAYDAEGNMRNMADVLGDLKGAMEGMTTQQKDSVLSDIFKVTDQAAARALINDLGKYPDLYEKAKSASDGAGASAEMYQTQLDNLKGDLALMKSAIEAFQNTIYESLVGTEGSGLRGVVEEVTGIVDDLHEAFSVDGLDGLATGIGEAIGDVSTTIGEKGATAITDAGDFATKLVNAIGGEGADVGGAAAKIITSIGTSFAKYTDDFVIAGGQLVQGLMDGLVAEGTAEQWASGLGTMVTNIGTWFSENGAQLGETAGTLVTQLATQIGAHSGEIISGGIGIIKGLAQGILTGIPILIAQLPSIMADIVSGIVESVPEFLAAGQELGSALLEGLFTISDSWSAWGADMELASRGMSDGLAYVAENAEAMNAAMTSIFESGAYDQLDAGAANYVRQLLEGKRTAEELSATLQAMGGDGGLESSAISTALSTYGELMAAAQEQVQAVQDASTAMTESAVVGAEEISTSASDGIQNTSSEIMSQFDEMQAAATETSQSMQEALTIDTSEMSTDALSTIIESIDTGNIDQITAQFETAMTALSTSANTASTSVQTSLTAMGTNSMTAVTTSLTGMLSTMGESFVSMIELASITSTSILTSFSSIDEITTPFDTTMTALSTSANTASTSVQTSLTDMGTNSLTAVTTSLTSMVTTMGADFVTMIELASITATSILSSFSSIDLGSVATNMMAGLTAGIEAGGAAAIAAAQSIASQIASTMASALKISSPSKVTEEIGNFTGQGLVVGMEGAESDVYNAAGALANSVQEGSRNSLSGVLAKFNSFVPESAPVQGGMAAGGGITFSPQITITGNASEADVRQALDYSMDQFRRMFRQMQAEDRRTAFA